MNTREINRILRQHPVTKNIFKGVFPCDSIPNQINPPFALVCNTDPSTKPGEHWVAMFVTSSGQGEYFDSYGISPLRVEFKTFLQKKCTRFRWNKIRFQSDSTSVCGQYCIFYLLLRSGGLSIEEIAAKLPKDEFVSDCFVSEWVNKYCRARTEIFEDDVLQEQIAVALSHVMKGSPLQ